MRSLPCAEQCTTAAPVGPSAYMRRPGLCCARLFQRVPPAVEAVLSVPEHGRPHSSEPEWSDEADEWPGAAEAEPLLSDDDQPAHPFSYSQRHELAANGDGLDAAQVLPFAMRCDVMQRRRARDFSIHASMHARAAHGKSSSSHRQCQCGA